MNNKLCVYNHFLVSLLFEVKVNPDLLIDLFDSLLFPGGLALRLCVNIFGVAGEFTGSSLETVRNPKTVLED